MRNVSDKNSTVLYFYVDYIPVMKIFVGDKISKPDLIRQSPFYIGQRQEILTF